MYYRFALMAAQTRTPCMRSQTLQPLDSSYQLRGSDPEFISLTDPRLAVQEYVYYRPFGEELTQKSLYINCCGERTVYRVKFFEGGCINTRVFNKIE
ncbi:E4-ORF6/7 [Bat mastadenovirus A]|uniref:E4-ORF6/7 n=1 Tax=Bat mastadenovirus A TaxID=1146877 RepID=A0A3G9ED88_9ADEN|nr:E4-ORF6/7 [Bat mastadenovirus A]